MKKVRLISWNVNGVRSVRSKGFLGSLLEGAPDVLCLQETKIQPDQLDEYLKGPPGYHAYWAFPQRKGYGGVATFTREEPRNVQYDLGESGLDLEGRVIAAEYPEFTLFNVYFPNGKASQGRLDYKMAFYDVFLEHADSLRRAGRKIVVCGDVNTAHQEIDLARPKENSKVSGFLPIERAWIDRFVSHGYVDTFRYFSQEAGQYTWWDMKSGARSRNVGWRIDYFFVSEDLLPSVSASTIMSDVMGSDHCPIALDLKFDQPPGQAPSAP
jgi:exodeoxyribonuclease-3